MRIKKGSRVEVWSSEASPMGAWRSGEVLWGNGHSYIVRYDHGDGLPGGNPVSRRIPRKCIRPCPPDVATPGGCVVGDMLEVFDECVWKCAEIIQVDGDGQLDAKIVGSTKVVRVELSSLRPRHVLREDDEWVLVHKDGQRAKEPPPCVNEQGDDNGGLMASAQKKRRHDQMDAEAPKDVKNLDNKRMRVDDANDEVSSSSDDGDTETDDDSDSETASCSSAVNSSTEDHSVSCRPPEHPNAHEQDSSKEAMDQVHRLELKAYDALMKAFYASGSLSWDQEELLSNIRLHLHISSNEHLQAIKELKSCTRR